MISSLQELGRAESSDGLTILLRPGKTAPANDDSLKLSFVRFALGRRQMGTQPAIRPRPELIADIIPALQELANLSVTRNEMQVYRSALTDLWSCLNVIDDENAAGGAKATFLHRLSTIPMMAWEKFSYWLSVNVPSSQSTYFRCKRVLNLAASLHQTNQHEALEGYPLAIKTPPKGPAKRIITPNDDESRWMLRSADGNTGGTWSVSFAELAIGRPQNGKRNRITARPELAGELFSAVEAFASRKHLRKLTVINYRQGLITFWYALDLFEEQEAASGKSEFVPIVLGMIPMGPWDCFREFLSNNRDEAYATYRVCKLFCDAAAAALHSAGATRLPGFPLAPNPFNGVQASSPKSPSVPLLPQKAWVVQGRSNLDIGHGLREWEVSCAAIVQGRSSVGALSVSNREGVSGPNSC